MTLLRRSIKWVMLVSGLLTCTMFYAAIAPASALLSTFGESMDGAVAQIVVRNWGVLAGIVGLMLLYGAFRASARGLVLLVAGTSKLAFITLVLIHGQHLLGFQLAASITVDSVMVVLFGAYLLASRRQGWASTG